MCPEPDPELRLLTARCDAQEPRLTARVKEVQPQTRHTLGRYREEVATPVSPQALASVNISLIFYRKWLELILHIPNLL